MRLLLRSPFLALSLLFVAPRVHAAPQKVVVFVAMPGAGKSTYANALSKKLGGAPTWSSGDVIRKAVADRFGTYTIEHDKAMRAEFNKRPGSVGEIVAAEVQKSNDKIGIIEGPRSPADVAAIRRALPSTKVVAIEVGSGRRYDRMLERGRSGETSVQVLRDRDASETKLGVRDVMAHADVHVRPGDGQASVERSVDRLVKTLELR